MSQPHQATGVATPVPGAGPWATLRGAKRLAHAVAYLLGVAIRMRWGNFARVDAAAQHDRMRLWSAGLLRCLGIRLDVDGTPRPGAKLIVANHVSWLDIMAINAVAPSRFVSKAEVGRWPVVGMMVTLAGTLYIERSRPRDAKRVLELLANTLREGRTAAVFPEGTTSEGHSVMPFHANLLQAVIDADVPVQPVALRYRDATHAVSPAASYAGEKTLPQSVWQVVTAEGLAVRVRVLPSERVTHSDRRALAQRLHDEITQALASE